MLEGTKKTNKNKYTQNVDFEAMKSFMYEISLKRAWLVAWTFGIAFVLSLCTILFLIPLKKEVPYLIMVDKAGKTDIVTLINEKQITVNEALAKHDIYRYVGLREGYYWDTANNDFRLLQLFSSQTEQDEVSKIYNPTSGRQIKFANKIKIVPDVQSIILSQGGSNTNIATVRAKLQYFSTKNNTIERVDNVIINLTYIYDLNIKLLEKYRVENPLGFTVTSYRIDKEL